jgi:hypothetical protein
VFTLRTFAAPEVKNVVVEPVLVQDCSGTLTVKSGQVSIDKTIKCVFYAVSLMRGKYSQIPYARFQGKTGQKVDLA